MIAQMMVAHRMMITDRYFDINKPVLNPTILLLLLFLPRGLGYIIIIIIIFYHVVMGYYYYLVLILPRGLGI